MIPARGSPRTLVKDRIVIGASTTFRWTLHVPSRQSSLGDTAAGMLAIEGSEQVLALEQCLAQEQQACGRDR